MALELTTPISFAMAVYLLVALALYYAKPELMFDEEGGFRQLGTAGHETIFPFWLATFAAGIIGYFWAYQYGNGRTGSFVPKARSSI